jgi:LuxR family maltose regulon positive regulatory protein
MGRTTARAAGIGRDGLLATKLHVPRPRPGFLPRPRLLERLADGAGRELVLVCTPAGFGKTTLLGDWARRSRQPVGWLSLEVGDNDPVRFWRYVVAALDGAGTGLGDQVAPLLAGPQPASLEAVVTAVVNGLAGLPDRCALVLDDYHVIEAPPIHHSLGFLLERLPAQLQVVLASRVDPPLPLARLRVRGQLTELRARDLRFTQDETAALLREVAGLDLSAASLAALSARTEGWVAGLQLAALSLQRDADPAAFVASFSGSHRFVLDYLTEEVLARQPEELVRFLLETSVLDRLSGPLCDAVTGQTGGQATLEQLERANLFLVPLDETRRWWRYHRLFAELLRARLERAQPDRVAALHRNAVAWLEDHGLVDEAVHHALAAGEADWAARLVEQHTQERFQRGEGATVDRWLAALPDGLIRARPRLSLARAIWALIGGRVDEVEPLLVDAEHAAGHPRERPADSHANGHANVPAMLAILRAELARQQGDADHTIEFAQQVLPQVAEDDGLLRYLVGWNLAVAMLLLGRVADAEPALAGIAADRWAAGEPYNALRACYTLSQAQRAQGRLGAALATCRQALDQAEAAGPPARPASGVAHVGLAEILREQDELDAALDHANQGVELCRRLGYAQWQVTSLDALAEALVLAWPEGYVRVFVDEGAPMADLLGRLVAARGALPAPAAGVPPGYLRQLLDAIDRESAPTPAARRGAAATVPGLVEPLSPRELEVLELLAAGRSNREIADQLVVALDTVKKHVSHILDKLGAGNRTQAAARARELGLVP